MPISFGRKNKAPEGKIPESETKNAFAARTAPLHPDCHLMANAQSSLVDLRSPETFRTGFIPGSYNVPDLTCVAAARRSGLFERRKIYLLADDLEQLQLCSGAGNLGAGAELAGWFGPDAIDEWHKMNSEIGSMEAIGSETLSIRIAAWTTLVIDIHDEGEDRQLSHPAALRFRVDDLPLALDGLPVESSICLTARTSGLTSFAASLLWNFGFRKISCLSSGCAIHFPLAW